ncbi:MAG: thioredoxin-dependent thiol peroxidase [Deltaproteobacteria bacterium CG11_big_fil_rev_8_21_14_0_20_42_23]|nr:MAG: thioredoxin-dependent thiol peroxidase [Deltaproteobacteria bacterium CG11_big_fil_rev_8_21_14_0_20_42_23]PJC63319.1 MAG: thioredoxin-dependent thiol peroxidase [Deltaproteobacteria bacterium CG_4_9_14_0_2_um_filter_42_21]
MPIPSVGDKAPDFTLPANDGARFSLSEQKGKKVVLYFYPKDDTPGCTTQACDFRDLRNDFSQRNAVVVGISRDGADSHQAFIQKHQLNFRLLTDADTKVHKMYGAWGEKNNYGKVTTGVLRTTVLIDEEGKILSLKNNVKATGNAEKTLGLLDSLVK